MRQTGNQNVMNNIGDGPDEMGNSLSYVDIGTDVARSICTGIEHACAIVNDGDVRCWGSNWSGQLGNEGDTSRIYVNLGENEKAKRISCNNRHTCVVLFNDQVKCWGDNTYGQLGLGTSAGAGSIAGSMGSNLPYVDLGTGLTAKRIVSGSNHNCALLSNDKVKCWGDNSNGQAGNSLQQSSPSQGSQPGQMGDNLLYVGADGNDLIAKSITSGSDHICALLLDGSVKCWGANVRGQLGIEDPVDSVRTPSLVPVGTDNAMVSAGAYSTCVIVKGTVQRLKCWGQCIVGTCDEVGKWFGEISSLAYIPMDASDSVSSVTIGGAGGSPHACVLMSSNKMKCFGSNTYGKLGYGTSVEAMRNLEQQPPVDLGTVSCAAEDTSVVCKGCPMPTFWLASASSCATCQVGNYYVDDQTSCTQCQNGKNSVPDVYADELYPSSTCPVDVPLSEPRPRTQG